MICFNLGGGVKPDQINELWETITTQSILILVLLIGAIAIVIKKVIQKIQQRLEARAPYIIACSVIVLDQYSVLSNVVSYSVSEVANKVKSLLENYEKTKLGKWRLANRFNEILRLIAEGQVATTPNIKKRAAELVARYDEIAKPLNNIK